MSTGADEVLLDVDGPVARITMSRPEVMNAMRTDAWAEMADMLRDIEHDPDIRCVVLTGAGEHFCSGGDVDEFATTTDLDPRARGRLWSAVADRSNQLLHVLERMPQPVVARVRGMAAGGGLALVAQADIAIASESSRFLAAQIKVGAVPDAGLGYNLVRAAGIKRAKEIALLGEVLDAHAALDAGLVTRVVPDAELDARTDEVVARLVSMPRTALELTKRAMNAAGSISLADHLGQESLDIAACVEDPEYVARVTAFLQRARR